MGLFAEKEFEREETVALSTGNWTERGGPYVLEVTRTKAIDAAERMRDWEGGNDRWGSGTMGQCAVLQSEKQGWHG